jgi:1-deoxy-D-xylulose 5-phosphate reductoisomerase
MVAYKLLELPAVQVVAVEIGALVHMLVGRVRLDKALLAGMGLAQMRVAVAVAVQEL